MAVLLPLHFITAMEWRLPWGTVTPTRGADAYLERLREIERSLADPSELLITWGYHEIWHGAVHRQALNRISRTRPVVVWQRSFHALYANDAALRVEAPARRSTVEWLVRLQEHPDRSCVLQGVGRRWSLDPAPAHVPATLGIDDASVIDVIGIGPAGAIESAARSIVSIPKNSLQPAGFR